MKNLTLANIALSCGGHYHGPEDKKSFTVTDITTDSRKVTPGCLFVAIKGARVDAHDFIPQVIAAGAEAVLSERDLGTVDFPYIQVESSQIAVKGIAEFYLKQLNIPVVGIVGSVGKTSTKEMVFSVLRQKYNVLKTEGNFNNELGVPLTVFRLRDEHRIAVLEMGISDFGEMSRLARITRPDTCIMTNIGDCHLENLHDREGVYKAKSEVFDFMRQEGHVILNGNDALLSAVKEVNGRETIHFGIAGKDSEDLTVFADQVSPMGIKGIRAMFHTPAGNFQAMVPSPGEHSLMNALAATAAGLVYGLTTEEIQAGIASYQAISGRFHVIETENYTIIDDCYNANPVSMKASLSVLAYASGRSVAVLGDMGELGEHEMALHAEVGRFAAENGIDAIYCAGARMKHLADAARVEGEHIPLSGGKRPEICHFEDKAALLEALPDLLKKGDTILVKASHFMGFEEIVKTLENGCSKS